MVLMVVRCSRCPAGRAVKFIEKISSFFAVRVLLKMRPFTQFSIRLQDDKLQILDQIMLPDQEIWLTSSDYKDMITFIKRLSVRGAPMIGVAAAMALAQVKQVFCFFFCFLAHLFKEVTKGASDAQLREYGAALRAARPTAVNLMHCIDRLLPNNGSVNAHHIIECAYQILADEVAMNKRMAELGAALIHNGEGFCVLFVLFLFNATKNKQAY
jgi:methylthioribose-1-phosphate isomerase